MKVHSRYLISLLLPTMNSASTQPTRQYWQQKLEQTRTGQQAEIVLEEMIQARQQPEGSPYTFPRPFQLAARHSPAFSTRMVRLFCLHLNSQQLRDDVMAHPNMTRGQVQLMLKYQKEQLDQHVRAPANTGTKAASQASQQLLEWMMIAARNDTLELTAPQVRGLYPPFGFQEKIVGRADDPPRAQHHRGVLHLSELLDTCLDFLETRPARKLGQHLIEQQHQAYQDGELDPEPFGIDGAGEVLLSHPRITAGDIPQLYQAFPNRPFLSVLEQKALDQPELMQNMSIRELFRARARKRPNSLEALVPLLEHPHPDDFVQNFQRACKDFLVADVHPDLVHRLLEGDRQAPGMKQGLGWLPKDELTELLGHTDDQIRRQVLRTLGEYTPASSSPNRVR